MTQQGRKRREIKPAGGMCVSEEGWSGSWVWRLSKGIKQQSWLKKKKKPNPNKRDLGWKNKNGLGKYEIHTRKWGRYDGETWLN